jgi:hypothetical protein
MPVPLTIENFREIERILKNAYRAVRAASYSASGGLAPDHKQGFFWNPGGQDIPGVRSIISNSNNVYNAAENVADWVSDYVQ